MNNPDAVAVVQTAAPSARAAFFQPGNSKIQPGHREKLAVVYVRQSSPQQVLENRESTARQYALVDFARVLGWPRERVLVIDEDQGHSGAHSATRTGFQRLLAEVTMDHVGLVLGLEMSRLARSSKDWHQLLELCGIFGTLLADQDGLYDAGDPNDRLLLGLKGTISEVELHTMRSRLNRGMLNKAQRAELFLHVPVGYVKTPASGIALDPDEQVRSVIQLIFDKFDDLGSGHAVCRYLLRHGIRVGIRPIDGPHRGELDWRRPSTALIFSILKHPYYAGAYAYGRCPVDPKRRHTHKEPRKWVGMQDWRVLLRDSVPAYITWDRYLSNRQRLQDNRALRQSKGAPRNGAALLGGIAVCGTCGRRLDVGYDHRLSYRYDCRSYMERGFEKTCRGVRADCVDELVTQQVLKALEPAHIELSLQAAENLQHERNRLTRHWRQQLERVQYDVAAAERRYRAVDPEHRLVARSLEQDWETALCAERHLQEQFDRFVREAPPQLTPTERELVQALSADIPALWHASGTTAADRKSILRCVVDRVVVAVRGNTEHVDVTIDWAGGFVSQHAVLRPVSRYEQLEDYDRLWAVVQESRRSGLSATQIAERLNAEGFRTPARRSTRFTKNTVNNLFARSGLRRPLLKDHVLGPHEWWLPNLSAELAITTSRLHHWLRKGYVHGRKHRAAKFWILWADEAELQRLRQLRDYLATEHHIPYPRELTQPRPRNSDH